MLSFSLRHVSLLIFSMLILCAPAAAQVQGITPYDDKSAVIFAYFAIGADDNPSGSVTIEQFTRHIDEISSGPYAVKPLPDIIDAFLAGKTLPPRTVALSFDGADKSVLEIAVPLLKQKNLPFTIFIPAGKVSSGKPPFMTWNDLRALKKTGLASFGLHPSSYSRLAGTDSNEIRRQINNSLATIRKELDVNPELLAYPFGEYDAGFESIAKSVNLKAAFGQQSGVAYAGDNLYALPRFTLTERYGDIDRFVMTAGALPFPVTDLSPADPHLKTLTPAIGFTVSDTLTKSLKNLSCFSSSDEKPELQILGNRVELRMKHPFMEDRPRINCTLPVPPAKDEDPRWRWLGMLYTVPTDLLEKNEPNEASAAHTE